MGWIARFPFFGVGLPPRMLITRFSKLAFYRLDTGNLPIPFSGLHLHFEEPGVVPLELFLHFFPPILIAECPDILHV